MAFLGENPCTDGLLGIVGGYDYAMCVNCDLFNPNQW